MKALTPSPQLLVKLGSLITHYQELTSIKGNYVDQTAIHSIEADEEVKEWLKEMNAAALLPKKQKP